MKLNLMYVPQESIGYGRLGVFLADALRKAGVDIYNDLPAPGRTPREGAQSGRCNVACWVSVPTHANGWWKGQIPTIFTMWEATVLPESFRHNLHEFDTMMVPSDHNVELFSQYHPNVQRVLLGVDPARWHYSPRQSTDQEFRFLIGGSGPRKGTDLAHKAFLRLWGREGSWGGGPTPVLMMKNPKGEAFYGPRIRMVPGKLSSQAETDLYAHAHCYLQPSRGEGFGLQPLQAIAQGMPTILTNAHGQASFAHLGYGLSTSFSKADYFLYGDAGEWWEPSLDELCDYMKYVYENYDEALAHAHAGALTVAREFTWQNTADQFLDALGRDRLTEYDGPDEWHESETKLYRVMVESGQVFEHADRRYVMSPDDVYWVPADVKRHMWESGLLHIAALGTEDDGLLPHEVAREDGYIAEHAYCPTCKQQLNSKPTKTEALYDFIRNR